MDVTKTISRREALAKLAKCSAYTAPTVVTPLSASPSYAQGSGVNAPQCGGRPNRNPMYYPNAADIGGNSNDPDNPWGMVNNPYNGNADCGMAS